MTSIPSATCCFVLTPEGGIPGAHPPENGKGGGLPGSAECEVTLFDEQAHEWVPVGRRVTVHNSLDYPVPGNAWALAVRAHAGEWFASPTY